MEILEWDRLLTGTVFAALLRLVPTLGYAFVARRVDWASKGSLAVFVAGVVMCLRTRLHDVLRVAGEVALVYVGWVLLCLLAIELRRRSRGRGVVKTGIATAIAIAWVLLPRLVANPAVEIGLMLVAVDRALAVLSAFAEPDDVSRRELAFFVLVDPTMSFRQRSQVVDDPAIDARAVLRLGAGLCALIAATVFDGLSDGGAAEAPLLAFARRAAIVAFVVYASHWGIASVQLVGVRSLGFAVPERYVRPLAAVGPRDFWTRWNTYMSGWLRDHVYVPTSRRLSRHMRRDLARELGTLAAFAVSGLVHVLAMAAAYRASTFLLFAFFAGSGLVVVLWDRALSLLERVRPGWAAGDVGRWTLRVLFLGTFIPTVSLGYAP